ncbi:hypothetical protein BWQ96_04224 [Gracilariopsis chorda]|uniref:Uncharacterized protein n=1 Tax=Gracilariopsis chorda TaxID=448386 RepID=A0A2V3IVD1_9FLOR|nr:hypothetical protein BWQ96_04224 [Gracilariopsis chorda]|eukprot:PXF46049.1 hypothetical protein BWQ96_04224 [Gracilariopsis chorda]
MSVKDDEILEEIDVSNSIIDPQFEGLACRERKWETFSTFFDQHKEALQHLFDRGSKHRSFKMGSSVMREHLMSRLGDRFDIPTESDIQIYIQVMFNRQKRGSNRSVRAPGIMAPYRSIVNNIVQGSNYTIAPLAVVKELKKRFNQESSLPNKLHTDAQVKNRVSSLKTAYRKEHFLPDGF